MYADNFFQRSNRETYCAHGLKTQHNKNVNSPPTDIVVNIISTKISAKFLVDTDKIVLKRIGESKGTKKAIIILKKKNKVGRICPISQLI